MEGGAELVLRVISKLWGVFTGLIVIGIIIYIGLLWATSQSITVEIKSIKTLTYNPLKNKVLICFQVEVNNTGYIDVAIEKLYYEVYIDNEYLGEGYKENIVVTRGVNQINICLEVAPSDALKIMVLRSLANDEKVNVTIKGYIDIPIKSFGYIKLWTLELPYEETFYVEFSK